MAESIQVKHCEEKLGEHGSADVTGELDLLEGEIDGDIGTCKRTGYGI